MEFKPKRSFGWAWLLALGLLLVYQPYLVFGAARNPLSIWMWLLELAIALLGVWFLALAALFPTMRYDVTPDELILRYGPMHWSVPLSEIREVRRTDLAWTVWSSMRFPGFALFRVPYARVGNVRMCATRSVTGILLIETATGRYGVTPEDEGAFVDALGVGTGSEPREGAIDG